jgi:two-component system nitrogen regulation sensor histidine kinase NtrY
MRFRTRLLLIFALTITGAVALVTGAVSALTRHAFETTDGARRQALLDQFQSRLAEQGADVVRRIERVAASRTMLNIAVEAGRPDGDVSSYVDEAQSQADAASLDFLDILRADGTIISSAHWSAKFNYKNDWTIAAEDRRQPDAFLTSVPTPEGPALALVAIRAVQAGGKFIELAGGKRLDSRFLGSLGLAPGMRALLWLDPHQVLDATSMWDGPETDRLASLVDRARHSHHAENAVVQWTPNGASAEAMQAMPLEHRGVFMGALIAGNSLRDEVWLERRILWAGLTAAVAGIALGVLMGWWATERVTRPVEQLAAGARAVAAGNWESRVEVVSSDEIGELAGAFNRMTDQLIEHRERAIQAERVAAWRELARRLAHELKNPLFPLQITVENMRRAYEQTVVGRDADFDEVFKEGTQLLVAELSNLRAIIGRFSDFAKMPPPELEEVEVNAKVREVMKLFDAQLRGEGRSGVATTLDLYDGDLRIHVDPEQLGRALRNLVLNALDAMPNGGAIALRTRSSEAGARIEVSDTGQGLTEEECSRLFTPYYTTKQHGTGLGLAIVQSVVSDHHGRIWVESKPGCGATFVIDLPR